ncbi:MAG: bifunctional [glutamine synthetase] adenylyltransferase/[glutamine synthetase]-adenylyl-L-tyrosine phosphorylase [Alphaproteobacteria bacterium]
MEESPFLDELTALPAAADPARAERGLTHWLQAAEQEEKAQVHRFARALARDPRGRALLDALFGNSPYLRRCLLAEMGYVRRLLARGPGACLEEALGGLEGADRAPRPELMARLRTAKRRVAVLTAVADIGGAWPLERVTGALTRFAEAALQATAAHVLRAAAEAGDIELGDHDRPEAGSGLIVLALGKLGAAELNYSSDIDLMVLYDDTGVRYRGRDGCQACFVRLARELVRIFQERAPEGYVFRIDLRLRPDPGATPLAVSTEAAETYYESVGQNWERAALIKARPVAGDRARGAAFLEALVPFIWRKHLDFAALQDIHSIKRQIDARGGGRRIRVPGHNIKLGRGGIREIEFFAQTLQLIWGGRDPSLRPRATCQALRALVAAGRLEHAVADDLIGAYGFLRRVEHRLQMVDDAQTHVVPDTAEGIEAFATFMGFDGPQAFATALTERLGAVERHYGGLFEEAPALAPAGNLVFTGTEDDPETVATLRRLGFVDGAAISGAIRAWHHGRFRATQSVRARELLTELMPTLLEALGKTADPDAAFLRFNEFLANLPAGVQLFSLVYANPRLLDVVAAIMGTAPELARHLARKAALLEGVLSSDFYDSLPGADGLTHDLARALDEARDFQDVLDLSRRWTHDRQFQVGVQVLRGQTEPAAAAVNLSDIADAVLAGLKPRVEAAFAEAHGRVPEAGLAVLGMGKLGGREMSFGSDLDLIFIYDHPAQAQGSDGPRPLAVSHYFSRLSQRLLTGLTALTGEGRLYDIDMRLRPSGKAGPLATGFAAFDRYQRESAWTWEHMALTRARVVTGPPGLRRRIEAALREILTRPRDPASLAHDVADMRRRIDVEHHTEDPWKVKYVRGGLTDIEFIAQYLELSHAAACPEVLSVRTADVFRRLERAGLLEAAAASILEEAAQVMQRLQSLLRLTLGGAHLKGDVPEGLQSALARAGDAPDLKALQAKLTRLQDEVRALFDRLVEAPAAAGGVAGKAPAR